MASVDLRRARGQGPALVAVLVLCIALLLPVAWLAHGDAHGFDDGCEFCPALKALNHALGPAAEPAMPAALAAAPATTARTPLCSPAVPSAVARGPPPRGA